MSDFFEDEAEESSDEDIVGTRKKPVIGLNDDKSASKDDAEDEEAVDKHLAAEADDQGNIRGLIDDDIVEEEEESDGSDSEVSSEEDEKGKAADADDEEVEEEIGKAKRRKRQYDHRLEDDDLDLIEENLGVKLKRKKFSRLKTVSSDEDDSDKEDSAEGGARENVANEIFAGQDFDEDAPQENRRPEPVITAVTEEEEESEESDVDDFIVDDNNEPISKPHAPGHKKKRKGDAALQNLHDIFGVDFDFSEFEKYGDQYEDEEEMEMEDDYYDEMDEEGMIGDAELRPKKKSKKAKKKKSIFDVYEPDTLERGYFTDFDAEIRNADVPERFQLRAIPVRPADDAELELEAEWIYRHGFVETTVSKQENFDDIGASSSLNRKPHSAIAKIQDSLNFMRNQQFEMPFIAFYRKEYVEPELNIHDLNKIYHWDEKWTQLLNRKANLTRLLQKMQTYQYEQISSDPDRPLGDNVRALTDADVERIQSVQTMDELKDVYAHFLLHYGRDIPKMQNALRSRRQRERNEDGTVPEGEEAQASDLKQASRRDMYTVCLNAGLGGVANKFGLTPEQFGENLRDNYQRHETEQYPAEPNDLAQDFITPQFDTAEKVLEGARYMMAMQLTREPLVRQCVRQTFQERAKINVKPTKKGKKEIDEAHPLYSVKYLKNKPIRDLTGPIFLHMVTGESERLIEIDIRIDMKGSDITASHTYFEEIKQLYYRDEFSQLVQEWNSQRSQVVEMMLNKILYPEMVKETRATLLREAKEGITNHCALTLRKWLAVAPYQPEEREDEEELDGRQGCTVMAVAYSDNRDSATFAAVISSDGEVTDFLRLPFMRVRKNAPNEEDRKRKEKDLENIKQFVLKRKPHVIVVAAEDRFALMLQEDIKACVTELEQEGSSAVSVELMDNELAAVYAATKRAETDFRDYPAELRQAVSLARKMQDPMLEFSQLCSQDDDLLCLKFHPLQDQVDKDQLLISLIEEFVFRACEVGVDVNRAIAHPHTTNVVQFVCGLGPRKAAHLVKVLKQKNGRLENRSNLVTVCRMGPKIFINCAAFIKIDTSSLGDSTDVYIEVLDGLRVHPETYEWARKMAVDALEYDESAEDANPSSALEEILESPERLKDLDLDAFADELERQGYGNKGITLYDIRNELDCRYKDLRTPYRPPTAEERFSLITKETLDTFQEGKLVTCRVVGIAYRRPKAEQLDLAEPHKDENTGTWSCSFCGTGGFGELSEVWSHLDSGDCLGKAVGVRTRLDNGVSGFIPTDRLSDSKVNNPEERVKVGMTIHCRIVKIDIDKFQVDLSSKSSDLRNESEKWGSVFDTYYDHDTEDLDKQSAQNSDKNKNKTTYIKRVVAHPSFHNVGFKEAEKILESMDQGDVVIRPSSKGSDHLTATWKVGENVYAHIDVKEEGKENSFSLGKTLLIGNDEFEDLDEIIARFIQPLAANARDILNHKYYRESNGGKKDILEEQLKQAKKHAPSRIPYFLSVCKELPGKFLLSYMPRTKPKHEYITVLSDGFRYRGQVFTTINQLFKWFKEHFRDPIPMHLMPSRTPAGATSNSSESGGSRFNVAAIQNALQSMQQTPRAAGQFATPLPRTQPYVTPNAAIIPRTPNYPPQRTPGYGAPQTPIQRTPASFTPHNRTPMAWGHPPAAVPPMRTPVGGGNPVGTDWGKAAEEWVRKKVPRGTPRRTPSGSTPRGPRTPAGSYRGSPRTPVHRTPRDGSTHA